MAQNSNRFFTRLLRNGAVVFIFLMFLVGCSGSGDPTTPGIEGAGMFGTSSVEPGLTDSYSQSGELDNQEFPVSEDGYLADEVLVVLHDEYVDNFSRTVPVNLPLKLRRTIECRWGTLFELKITDGTSVPVMVERLKADSRVRMAEPNYIFEFHEAPYWPNDPLWERDDPGENPRDSVYDQWGPSLLGADLVWNEGNGSEDVVVAVIDTGVRSDHEDLIDNLWNNEDEIPGNGIDDDENGWIDDTWGWDCWSYDNDPWDDGAYASFHGTACSGVVAAVQDNSLGLSGVAPGIKIMALKTDLTGSGGLVSTVVEALSYALINEADICSMSFGTGSYSEILETACNDTWDQGNGVILMASSGNNNNTNLHYPSGYASVMAIGASIPWRSNNTRTDEVRLSPAVGYFWGSNYGSHLTVMGFGDKYTTTYGGGSNEYWNGYGPNPFFNGTSNACPMSAGVMALIRSYFPNESLQWSVDRIQDTADDLVSVGFDNQTGYGRCNVLRAIYGSDRWSDLEDALGFVELNMQQDQLFDSIHHLSGNPYEDVEDLYKLTILGDGELQVYLDIYTWGENLDLAVYSDPEMTNLAAQSTVVNHANSSFEELNLNVLKGEQYYLRVYSPAEGNSTTYRLMVHNFYDYIRVMGEDITNEFIHYNMDDIPFLKLTVTTGTQATLDELNITKSGTMDNLDLAGIRLYRDSNGNGIKDDGDELIGFKNQPATNRAVFTDLNLSLTYGDGEVLFVYADLNKALVGSTVRLAIETYKDVVTLEGISAGYEEFPVGTDWVPIGIDFFSPDWVTTAGAQSATPLLYAARVKWNEAIDEESPPVKYNIYYTEDLPFNMFNAGKVADVSFEPGGSYDYQYKVTDLPGDVEMHFIVRAEDGAGNEDGNIVNVSCIPIGLGDPTAPVILATYSVSQPYALAMGDNFLSLCDSTYKMLVYDRSDQIELEKVSTWATTYINSISADGAFAYCSDPADFSVVNIANPLTPSTTDSLPLSGVLMSEADDNWVYAVKQSKELVTIDASNPWDIYQTSSVQIETTGAWRDMTVTDNVIYISYQNDGIHAFNRSIPSDPVFANKFGTEGSYGVYASDGLLYATDYTTKELLIYNIAVNPLDPPLIGSSSDGPGASARFLVVKGVSAYVISFWGIVVYDVSDPTNPQYVGDLPMDNPQEIVTDGNFLYVTESTYALNVIV